MHRIFISSNQRKLNFLSNEEESNEPTQISILVQVEIVWSHFQVEGVTVLMHLISYFFKILLKTQGDKQRTVQIEL
jgi:hypothetical protein